MSGTWTKCWSLISQITVSWSQFRSPSTHNLEKISSMNIESGHNCALFPPEEKCELSSHWTSVDYLIPDVMTQFSSKCCLTERSPFKKLNFHYSFGRFRGGSIGNARIIPGVWEMEMKKERRNHLEKCFSNFKGHRHRLGNLLKCRFFEGPEWGLRFCISNSPQGDADTADAQTTRLE